MRDRTTFLILTTVVGFLTLCFFSIMQRLILGLGFMTDPRAYLVPFCYGGTIGFWLGMRQLRIWKNETELRANVETLQRQSAELKATEETLRCQIAEHHAARQRLLASEESLLEKNDELVATEEMLRAQIEENRRGGHAGGAGLMQGHDYKGKQ